MPYKDRMKKILYDREWRKRQIENHCCMRCGAKLIEGEGKCCFNCSSKDTRQLITIGGMYENFRANQVTK